METIGDVRDQIIADDQKQLEKILDANKHRRDPYWVVLFAKPGKVRVDGKMSIVKVFKPYNKKPQSQVGMIYGEVDNKMGKIFWRSNMPDANFDQGKLLAVGAKECQEVLVDTTDIPEAYITQN